MYGGHYAAALMLRAVYPRAPARPLLLSVGALDIINGVFLMTGVEHVSVDLREFLGFKLDFIDWDHSLVMALAWSALAFVLFWKNVDARLPVALGVFSHWVLDWPLHTGDLALYPYSDAHLGLGLWGSLGTGAWWLELAWVFLCSGIYIVRSWHPKGPKDTSPLGVVTVVVLLQVSYAPIFSPLRMIAERLASPS